MRIHAGAGVKGSAYNPEITSIMLQANNNFQQLLSFLNDSGVACPF